MQSIFDQDMRDWALYDLVLNTEHYGADGAAEVAIKAAQNMLVEPEPEDSLARLGRNGPGQKGGDGHQETSHPGRRGQDRSRG